MPALAVFDGAALLLILGIEQGGALGAYSAREIDARETALGALGDLAEEFEYCSGLLIAAGYDPSNLDAADYSIASRVLAYGCAYRLLQLDRSSQIVQPATKDGAGIIAALDTSAAHFFARADGYYTELGIVSKYRDIAPSAHSNHVYH